MSIHPLERLITNAQTAHNEVKGEWGKNYWAIVIAHLMRVANRLN